MENVISISNFKTDTLHKYMIPIYAVMNLNQFASSEEKQKILADLIPNFFRRLRKYREIELEEISRKYQISLEHLQSFESGRSKPGDGIQHAYVWACGGHHEIDVLERQIREFQHPSFKDARLEHAQIAAQVGVVIPGLDYTKLNGENGTILPLCRRDQRELQ